MLFMSKFSLFCFSLEFFSAIRAISLALKVLLPIILICQEDIICPWKLHKQTTLRQTKLISNRMQNHVRNFVQVSERLQVGGSSDWRKNKTKKIKTKHCNVAKINREFPYTFDCSAVYRWFTPGMPKLLTSSSHVWGGNFLSCLIWAENVFSSNF